MNRYDVAIIGSGSCGYVAAIRAAQLGLKVCIFEKDDIGGVCLNSGCIPTKALLASSEALYNVGRAGDFGVEVKDYAIDFAKVYERKNSIVKKLSSGVEMLMRARKIEIRRGKAQIKDSNRVVTQGMEIETNNILIATGSLPFEIPEMSFDGAKILSSSDILQLQKIPRSIIIVGGGAIGCEFASIFRTLGSEVTIVEMMEQLLPSEDEEIARKIGQIFKRKGINVYTKTKVERIEKERERVNTVLSNGATISGEKLLICVGRVPDSKDIGIEEVGIESDRGWIKVDESFRTNVKNIYAAGDVKGGILLAHVASREGICAVESMRGKETTVDYNIVPRCIFTHPEIASVGINEKQAKQNGLAVRSRKFLFSALGKAHILGEVEGFIKLVVDNKNDRILGAQILGPHASDLISEISPCIQFAITSEKLAGVIHAHPTLSEGIKEVSEAAHDRAIHSL